MMEVKIASWSKEKALLAIFLLIGLTGGVLAFTQLYFSNSNVLIGLCLIPFSLVKTGQRRTNFFYATLIIVFGVLAFSYQIRIFYFFSLAFYFLWLIELFSGRQNTLILFLIVFMSPIFIQVVTILGFPIRLMLSAYAGTLLKLVHVNVQIQGNLMMLNGVMFSVDEACMGLNMLAMSMLMGVFLLAFHYRVSSATLGLYATGFFFVVAFILNMIANVFRIVVLVYFQIPAENLMHELTGILCLIVYVLIPLHFLGRWLIRKFGNPKIDSVSQPGFSRFSIVLMTLLPLVVLSVGTTIDRKGRNANPAHPHVNFGDVKPEMLDDGITKIATDDLLIYVKAIPEFFTAEHTPLMCWKGSGYKFSGVATATTAGVTIYKGTLIKDGETLHTAWWYSNGTTQTISQLDWRIRMLKGEANFCLVNVTAKDEQVLMRSINSIFTKNPITIQS